MFAYAVRLRRKRPVKEARKETSFSGKVVAVGFMCTFFGSIFLFLELFGKCNCKLDVIGGSMLAFGLFVLTLKCLIDLCHDLWHDEEDAEVDVETAVDDVDTVSMYSQSMEPDQVDCNLNETCSLHKPMLISREVSPVNSDIKLIGKEQFKVLPCVPKLNLKTIRESGYNLPAVVMDT